MTSWQKAIKYLAMAFAIFLIACIFAGIFASLGAFGFIDGLLEGKNEIQIEDMNEYPVAGDIKNIEIEVAAAEFSIKTAERFYVETNIKGATVKNENGCLEIDDNCDSAVDLPINKTAVLNVYIPAETVFDEAVIDAGVGVVSIHAFTANELDLNFGAGNADISNLTAFENIEMNGGTGEITISNCSLNDPEISVGVGEFTLSGSLKGQGEIDLGIGEANIDLTASDGGYRLSVSKGIGEATVNGQNVSNNEIFGNGENRIDISGGIGEVNVKFAEN